MAPFCSLFISDKLYICIRLWFRYAACCLQRTIGFVIFYFNRAVTTDRSSSINTQEFVRCDWHWLDTGLRVTGRIRMRWCRGYISIIHATKRVLYITYVVAESVIQHPRTAARTDGIGYIAMNERIFFAHKAHIQHPIYSLYTVYIPEYSRE